jgi:hypothetical protein
MMNLLIPAASEAFFPPFPARHGLNNPFSLSRQRGMPGSGTPAP